MIEKFPFTQIRIAERHFEEIIEMKFENGSAFLNHYFVKQGCLTTWLSILPKDDFQEMFSALEHNLNEYSKENSRLGLTVPMLYIEGNK